MLFCPRFIFEYVVLRGASDPCEIYYCENALFQREMKSAISDLHYKSHPVALVGPDKQKLSSADFVTIEGGYNAYLAMLIE